MRVATTTVITVMTLMTMTMTRTTTTTTMMMTITQYTKYDDDDNDYYGDECDDDNDDDDDDDDCNTIHRVRKWFLTPSQPRRLYQDETRCTTGTLPKQLKSDKSVENTIDRGKLVLATLFLVFLSVSFVRHHT